MTRLGVVVTLAVVVAACGGSAGSSTTDAATSVSAVTSTTTIVTSTTAGEGPPAVWRDSACLQRFDPPRASPPDGYVPHLICRDDPTRIAPVARGFRNPRPAIDAVLAGPTEEEAAVGFESVGHVGGYDYSEGEDIIEVILDGPTTPELAAAVKATLEWGTTKTVTVR